MLDAVNTMPSIALAGFLAIIVITLTECQGGEDVTGVCLLQL